ncbi:MAG: helix-hairpin-helix domain-containing protein [Eubacterium sp.]|nr:helix-hairpin-helix domain-containing protein [Eubacterium sp.]
MKHKDSKLQIRILIGFALLIVAGVMFYSAFRMPLVYDTASDSSVSIEESSTAQQVTYPLNINEATVEELMTINGLGYERASLIVSYREEIGGYTSVEQIKNIYGFDDVMLNKISPYLTV